MNDRFSYDEFPYLSKFFLQTHPDRLATSAALYGLPAASPANCRVLELGCGNGSNLIAQAFGLPDSQFIGVDLSATHIEKATSDVHELGLTNIDFRQMDLMNMSVTEFGKFDYITAHGLFAWVPEIVRTKVLSLCFEMLTDNGVGYISYNAYPGSYIRDMGRSMMMFHTRNLESPLEKVESAMAFFNILATKTSERDVYGRILESELQRHAKHQPPDIYHDDLSECYRPFYFHEFIALLDEHALQFLSEAEIHASGVQALDEEAIAFLGSIPDRLAREQYLDFLRGRVFRQTLFCRMEVKLADAPTPEALDDLLLSSTLRPVENISEISSAKVEKFKSAKGQQMQIDHPLTKAALIQLGESWGRSVSTPDLLSTAADTLKKESGEPVGEAQFETTKTILLRIALNSDLIELHIHQPEAEVIASDRPRVNRLARWQLRDANNVLTLLNKDLKLNDKTSRHLLELLDGTRSIDEIEAEIKPFIATVDDINDKEKKDLLGDLSGWLRHSIDDLARLGLFDA